MNRPRRARGFTLVEVAASLAITSVTLGALISGTIFLTRALPAPDDTASRSAQITALLSRFHEDSAAATGTATVSSTGVKYTVPDRDGDGTDDTITYEWAGTGNPLVRTRNTVETHRTPALTTFAIKHDTADPISSGARPPEATLWSHEHADGEWYAIPYLAPIAQGLAPADKGDTEPWCVYRVTIVASVYRLFGTASGTVSVGVFAADENGRPEGGARATADLDVTWAGADPTPVSLVFDTPPAFEADEDAVLVINADTAYVYVRLTNNNGQTAALYTTDDGDSWSPYASSVVMTAHGTVQTSHNSSGPALRHVEIAGTTAAGDTFLTGAPTDGRPTISGGE